MKTTENYGFKKPENTDFFNVEDFNGNMDILDEKLKETSCYVGDLSQTYDYDVGGFISVGDGDGKTWLMPQALRTVYNAVCNLSTNGVGRNKTRLDEVSEKLTSVTDIEKATVRGSDVAMPFSSLNSYISVYCARCGNVVTLYIYIAGGNLEAGVKTTIGQLAKWKPIFPVGEGIVEGTAVGKLNIATSGEVSVTAQSKSAYYSASVTYITEDI